MIIPVEIKSLVELYVEELWKLGIEKIGIYLDKSGVCVGAYKGSFGHRQYFNGIEFMNVTDSNAKECAQFLASRVVRELKRVEEGV